MNQDFDHCLIDIADDTVIYAPVTAVIAVVGDSSTWRRWWPDLTLKVYGDRGNMGLRWTVSGSLVGSSEIWLEPLRVGTLLGQPPRLCTTTCELPPREPAAKLCLARSRILFASSAKYTSCASGTCSRGNGRSGVSRTHLRTHCE